MFIHDLSFTDIAKIETMINTTNIATATSGTSIVLSQMFDGQYFIQSLIYFSFALLSLVIFGLIVWRILK